MLLKLAQLMDLGLYLLELRELEVRSWRTALTQSQDEKYEQALFPEMHDTLLADFGFRGFLRP